MNDTTAEMARLVALRFARMTGSERVSIAVQMNRTAREIVLSSLPGNLDPAERQRRLCRRLYGELADRAFP